MRDRVVDEPEADGRGHVDAGRAQLRRLRLDLVFGDDAQVADQRLVEEVRRQHRWNLHDVKQIHPDAQAASERGGDLHHRVRRRREVRGADDSRRLPGRRRPRRCHGRIATFMTPSRWCENRS